MLSFNGDGRWRLSRWLAGGFCSCWLLRCTDPQLSAAQRKVLVPFIAYMLVLSLVFRIAIVWGFVNSRFHNFHNFQTCALLNATSPVGLTSLEANRPIPPDRKVGSFAVAMYCLFTYRYMLLPRAITVRRFC